MKLALSENEVTTLTNFHDKTDTTTLLNTSLLNYDTSTTVTSKITTVNDSIYLRESETALNSTLLNYDTTITVNSKITTVNDSINLRVSETTLNSTLVNYLGLNLSRSSALVKSVNVSDYDY